MRISASALDMAAKCGQQYRFRYLDGLKVPPSGAAVIGRSAHYAQAHNLAEKMVGKACSAEEVQDLARSNFDAEWQGEFLDPEADYTVDEPVRLNTEERAAVVWDIKSRYKDSAGRLATAHAEQLAPQIYPAAVEQGFEVELFGWSDHLDSVLPSADDEPVTIRGYIDVLEEETGLQQTYDERYPRRPTGLARQWSIRDTKNKPLSIGGWGKALSKGFAQHEWLQGLVYALAVKATTGALPRQLVVDSVVDYAGGAIANPKSQKGGPVQGAPQTVKVTDADLVPVIHRIESVLAMRKSGVFPPASPSWWGCSKKWCGYWDRCKYAKRPVSSGSLPVLEGRWVEKIDQGGSCDRI